MLFRTPKVAAEEMPQREFVSRLTRTDIGRQVISVRDNEVNERRRAAADMLVSAVDDSAETLLEIDDSISRVSAEIAALADQLQDAQTKRAELMHQKAETMTRRDRTMHAARAELFATAPTEFIALESLAKLAEHSAKFQARLRIPEIAADAGGSSTTASKKIHDDAVANHAENRKLLGRAIEVRREITSMILKAKIGPTDHEHAERLRRYLAVPAHLD